MTRLVKKILVVDVPRPGGWTANSAKVAYKAPERRLKVSSLADRELPVRPGSADSSIVLSGRTPGMTCVRAIVACPTGPRFLCVVQILPILNQSLDLSLKGKS